MYLKLGKIVVQRVTVIKFGMYYGGCNDTGRFAIKIRTDAAKLTNVRIARFRECRDSVRECEMFVHMKPRLRAQRVVLSEELGLMRSGYDFLKN